MKSRPATESVPSDHRAETGEASPPFVVDRPDGAVLSVIASPRSHINQVGPVEGEMIRIRVTAAAVDGAANAALVRVLADAAGVPKSAVEIIAGQSSRRKRVLFRGLDAIELVGRLRRETEAG